MKYFVLGTVILAATFVVGCDSSGVCCKGGAARSAGVEKSPKVETVKNDENMTISYAKSLKTYDWNVTTEELPYDANCTFTSHASSVVIPKFCFGEASMKNSVSIAFKGTNQDDETINETKSLSWETRTSTGAVGNGS